MDRAYENEATHQAALNSEFIPAVPPKRNRKERHIGLSFHL